MFQRFGFLTVVQAASVLMILLAVSPATFAAGENVQERCLCTRGGKVSVVPGTSSGSLRPDATGVSRMAKNHLRHQWSNRHSDRTAWAELQNKDANTAFDWKPSAAEHRWVYVVIHHSATESGSVESIHASHRQRKDAAGNPWLGIGYHFVIGNGSGMEDGKVESTFRWRQQIHGAHSGSTDHNANGIGVCLIGNFQQDVPTQKQLEAVSILLGQLSHRYQIPAALVIGHNTVKPTACPGKHFPLQDVIRKSVSKRRSTG